MLSGTVMPRVTSPALVHLSPAYADVRAGEAGRPGCTWFPFADVRARRRGPMTSPSGRPTEAAEPREELRAAGGAASTWFPRCKSKRASVRTSFAGEEWILAWFSHSCQSQSPHVARFGRRDGSRGHKAEEEGVMEEEEEEEDDDDDDEEEEDGYEEDEKEVVQEARGQSNEQKVIEEVAEFFEQVGASDAGANSWLTAFAGADCDDDDEALEELGVSSGLLLDPDPFPLHSAAAGWCGLCGTASGWVQCGACDGTGGYATRPGLGGVKDEVRWARCKTCYGWAHVPCLVCGVRDLQQWLKWQEYARRHPKKVRPPLAMSDDEAW